MQINKVLVPVKGADSDFKALSLAQSVTRGIKSQIYVVYVIEIGHRLPLDADISSETARGEKIIQDIERLTGSYEAKIQAEILQARDAGPALVQEAVEHQVDAIILALPYKRRHGVFSLGGKTPYILKNAPCPVLLVRGELDVGVHAEQITQED